MAINEVLRSNLQTRFAPLNIPDFPWPGATSLSQALSRLVPQSGEGERIITEALATQFCTAAIDIWLRGVHSFLVSIAITEGSPVWASVSGYYASHYAVRGLAHLEGIFQLFQKKKIVRLSLRNGQYVCTFSKKAAGQGEHQVYWKFLKREPDFRGNELFTENTLGAETDASDIRHRSHANYADHLFPYKNFTVLERDAIRERIDRISTIMFDTAPIPRVSKYADLEYVQLVAYHRLVCFRSILDQVLGGGNQFWNQHRTPIFTEGLMSFQLVAGGNPLVEETFN